MAKKKAVEDIYRLSELQEAMLMHRLRHGDSDTGLILMHGALKGRLDVESLAAAWRGTIARHPVLRSSVHWEDLKHPVQVVAREAALPWTSEDWRGVPAADRESRFSELLRRRRAAGLDISRAPVMSWTLARTADDEHRFVWTCHHVLLDGWSSALVLDEVLGRYAAQRSGRAFDPPPVRPFREYVSWSRGEAAARAAAEWRPRSWAEGGFLSGAAWSGEARVDSVLERRFEALDTAAVEAWVRSERITAGALYLACWGLVLAEATGSRRPTVGFTASGRAGAFDGIETIVGMFANALPLQLSVDRDRAPADWFREVFAARQALQPFEHCSLARLLQAGGFSLRRPPFDTLVAVANFPGGASLEGRSTGEGELRLSDFRGGVTSAYPLTLAVTPDSSLRVEAHHDGALVPPRRAGELLDRFGALVGGAVAGSAATLGDLLATAPGRPAQSAAISAEVTLRKARAARRDLRRAAEAEPAATATEAQLMRIWNDLIAVQEFGPEDNFFDLGGHSLLVPQMLDRVLQDFGVELGAGVVFGAPTVRELAAALESHEGTSSGEPSWRSLVSIRERGDRAPLYMVHGLGGEIGWFYNLANYLDPDVPLYGLQAPPEPLDDLEAMAARYVAEVRSLRPDGPYRVGGYCIGGGVAFEMARQLSASGLEVDAVVLIDSVPQSHAVGEQARSPTRLASRARRLMAKEPRQIVASIKDFGQRKARGLTRRVAGSHRDRPVELSDVLDMDTLPRVYRAAAASHFRAMRDYRPRPYDGDVWLFRTHDDRFGEDFGWRSLVRGRLGIEKVSGAHIDVLKEPHVGDLGRRLSAILRSVDDLGS